MTDSLILSSSKPSYSITMSDQPLDDSTIHWVDVVSQNGKKFSVGTKKGSDGDAPQVPGSFLLDLDPKWVKDGKTKDANEQCKAVTGIYQYRVGDYDRIIYDYYVAIKTSRQGQYYFHDEEGDSYGLSVIITSNEHYVRYNSGNPTIGRVTGHF